MPEINFPAELSPYFTLAVSVDCVLFGFDNQHLKILLIKRGADPYRGMWALPGDLVQPEEDIDSSAKRVLKDLTGLNNVYLEQVRTFGEVERHPLGRVLTVAYFSLVKIADYNVHFSSWAEGGGWYNVYDLPELAFDHSEIISACLLRLRRRVRARPVGFDLLPKKFTLSELQTLYEAILGVELDKRNFRRKVLGMDLLVEEGDRTNGLAHRPAKLYHFDPKRYERLVAEGFNFTMNNYSGR